ncbi:MAG: CHAT domain-containing protein, partial [Oscillatoria sp. PMC 1076.18]|nr:CHAT domain-containing protein [Oscillatoria sp. PMC 1076.18]
SQLRTQPYGIVHLGTHAEFKETSISNAHIQFFDNKLGLDNVRELRLKDVELLVLSACQTALGNESAELGFAGFAHQAGVKSVIASLWVGTEDGSLALLSQFYRVLKQENIIKAEALRQAQIAMIRGEVSIKDGQMFLPGESEGIPLTGKFENLNSKLEHPYYWSNFTIVGNPW